MGTVLIGEQRIDNKNFDEPTISGVLVISGQVTLQTSSTTLEGVQNQVLLTRDGKPPQKIELSTDVASSLKAFHHILIEGSPPEHNPSSQPAVMTH